MIDLRSLCKSIHCVTRVLAPQRRSIGIRHKACLVVSQYELAKEGPRLWKSRMSNEGRHRGKKGKGSGKDAYRDRLESRNKVTRGMEQCVGPPTFLMYNTGKFAVIIIPWRAWLPCESLDTSKRCILRVVKVALALGPSIKRILCDYLDRNWRWL